MGRWLVPVASGNDEKTSARQVDSFLPIVGHHDHLHVAVDDLEKLVGVGVHFPPRRSLRPIKAASQDRIPIEVSQLDVVAVREAVEGRLKTGRVHGPKAT